MKLTKLPSEVKLLASMKSLKQVMNTLLLIILIMSYSSVNAVQLPTTESIITVLTDGTPNFNVDDTIGHDSSDSNDRVRNFDLVTYNIEVSLNGRSDTNVVVKSTLNDKAKWVSLPTLCLTSSVVPLSELTDTTGDGLNDTLVCNLGDHDEGTKLILQPTAFAVGGNGDTIEASVCSDSDNNSNTGGNATAQCHGPVQTLITAVFSVSLEKSVQSLSVANEIYYRPPFSWDVDSGLGDDARLMEWHIALVYAKGSELIKNDNGFVNFTLNDTWNVTHLNAGDITATDGFTIDACEAVDSTASYTVACNQPGGAGTDVTISLTGVDVRDPKPFTLRFTAWVPFGDITQSGAFPNATIDMFNTANIVSYDSGAGITLAPLQSVSNTPNPSTETDNADFTVSTSSGGGNLNFLKTFDNLWTLKTGQRAVAKGELVETTLYINDYHNQNTSPGLCDVIDTSKFEYAGYQNDQISGVYHGTSKWGRWHEQHNPHVSWFVAYPSDWSTPSETWNRRNVSGLDTGLITLEYSDTPNAADYFSTTCDDAGNNWVTDPTTLAGGLASVTKIRMLWDRNLTVMETLSGEVGPNIMDTSVASWSYWLKVKDVGTTVTGDHLANVASVKRGRAGQLDWITANDFLTVDTDPASGTYSINSRTADRVVVVDAHMMIRKENNPLDLGAVSPRDMLHFDITPTTVGTTAGAVTLTLTDTFPAEISYVSDTCASVISGCVVDLSGLPSTVTWTIPNHTVGAALGTFDVTAQVTAGAVAGGYVNMMAISSDNPTNLDDNSQATQLVSEAGITIVSGSGVYISKSASPPSNSTTLSRVDSDYTSGANDFTFTLNYENLGGTFNQGHIIDILPYNGDSSDSVTREPSSSFSGDLDFVSITGSNGETFEYSTDVPTSIHHEPCHPTNWSAAATVANNASLAAICTNGLLTALGDTSLLEAGTGATTWIAGLPATQVDREATTAIRVSVANVPAGTPPIVDLVVRGAANQSSDRYCNNFASQFNQSLDEISNDVCVLVSPVCVINQPTVSQQCNDAGTPSDPSDDTFTYTINTTGTDVRASYNISDGDTQTGLSYGVEHTSTNSFLILNGNLTLTLMDASAACSVDNILVTAPASCSTSKVDLEIRKEATPASVTTGDTVIYKLTVTNKGAIDATGIVVTDNLPVGVVYQSHSPVSESYIAGSWAIGNLANGTSVSLDITVKVQ